MNKVSLFETKYVRVMNMNQEKMILEEITKGLEMGIQSIEEVKSHIENKEMKLVVEKQQNDYREDLLKAKEISEDIDSKPSGNALETAFLKSMIKMKTLWDASSSHLATMLIQGSDMLMIDLNKIKNDYVKNEKLRAFVDHLLKDEQTHIDALKTFL